MSLNLDKSTWKQVSFGDVVKNVNVTVKPHEIAAIERVIAMEHLDPRELKIKRWGSSEDGTTFTRRVKPGQTLFGKRRAYQRKAAYADFDAITSGDILVFEADQRRLLPTFLPFLVQSDGFYDHALGTSAGSLSPRTNWRDLAAYQFDLPPIDMQNRLVALLWAVEQQLQDSHQLWSALDTARVVLLDKLIDDIPGPQTQLDSVLQIVRGGSPRPINDYFTNDPDGLNWIKIGDVPANGKYIDSTSQKIKPTGLSKTRRVKPGDLLLSNSMSFGRPYIVRIDGCIHDGWLSLSDVHGLWRTEYLYYLLRSKAVQGQFAQGAGGSTVKNLNIDIVRRVTVAVPSLVDQDRVLLQMTSMVRALDSVTRVIDASTATKQALLQQVFGGST